MASAAHRRRVNAREAPGLIPNLSFEQAQTQFPKLCAVLPTFGVRLEGLMLKLKNPLLDDC
jgi:hypothetical protein